MSTIIEVSGINKEYKQDRVLKDVTIAFEQGKIHGLIGKNGSGKTMLLKCICGLVTPTSGQVSVRGKVIGKDEDFPSDVGVIIEAPGFLPYYSGMKNLSILVSINKKIDKAEIERTIERVGLDPKSKKHVGKYSLGMRQRLGIAQAIMEDPDLLLLDEPMNGLDKHGIADVRELLTALSAEGKTILLASHSTEDIDMLCDTVSEMDGGVLTPIKTLDAPEPDNPAPVLS